MSNSGIFGIRFHSWLSVGSLPPPLPIQVPSCLNRGGRSTESILWLVLWKGSDGHCSGRGYGSRANLMVSAIIAIIIFIGGLFYFRRMEKTFADIVWRGELFKEWISTLSKASWMQGVNENQNTQWVCDTRIPKAEGRGDMVRIQDGSVDGLQPVLRKNSLSWKGSYFYSIIQFCFVSWRTTHWSRLRCENGKRLTDSWQTCFYGKALPC